MEMNVKSFKDVLRKASINYLVPSVSLRIWNGKVVVASASPDNNAFVFLTLPNGVIDNDKEDFEFNFADIMQNLKPYLDLIKDEIVNVKVDNNKLIVKDSQKKKMNWFFCTKEFTNHFSGDDRSDEFDYFYETKLNQDFLNIFNEIKKIATRFGKIYFTCKDGKIYIESTDKTNSFCNSLDVEMDDVKKDFEVTLCFDFKNLSNIITTIEDEIDQYTLKMTYIADSDAGMAVFSKGNQERYFITSKSE